MSGETKIALETFAKEIRWHGAAQPEDQNRFFDFVITAFKNGDHEIEQDTFVDLLSVHDPYKEMATPSQKKRGLMTKLYTFHKYEEGIKLLKRFSNK